MSSYLPKRFFARTRYLVIIVHRRLSIERLESLNVYDDDYTNDSISSLLFDGYFNFYPRLHKHKQRYLTIECKFWDFAKNPRGKRYIKTHTRVIFHVYNPSGWDFRILSESRRNIGIKETYKPLCKKKRGTYGFSHL